MILHDTMDRHLLTIDKKGFISKLLLNSKTPTKSGSIVYNNLMLQFRKDKEGNDINLLESIKKLYTTVSGSPRVYVDNTIEMYNKMLQQTSANKSIAASGAWRKYNEQACIAKWWFWARKQLSTLGFNFSRWFKSSTVLGGRKANIPCARQYLSVSRNTHTSSTKLINPFQSQQV